MSGPGARWPRPRSIRSGRHGDRRAAPVGPGAPDALVASPRHDARVVECGAWCGVARELILLQEAPLLALVDDARPGHRGCGGDVWSELRRIRLCWLVY